MSYDLTAFQSGHFSTGYVDRGQNIQLAQWRLWMSAAGTNAAPRISLASGTATIFQSARQTRYPDSISGYSTLATLSTNPVAFIVTEQYQNTGDCCVLHFTDGVAANRVHFNVADQYKGVLLSIENLTVPVPTSQGGIGADKVNGWLSPNQELVYGNIAVRIPATGLRGLQFRHVNSAFFAAGHTELNQGGSGANVLVRPINKTSTLAFQAFAPSGQQYSVSALGSAEIADFLDTTNNIKYRVTCIYFRSGAGSGMNYFNVTIERFQ